jgi:DNA polymerase II small subunit/DNA polymerase delta subunit B
MGVSRPSVTSRCANRIPYEFTVQAEYTCRYADEWDALSPSARLETIRRAVDASENRTTTNRKKPVVVVDRQARERMRYASISDAREGEYVSDDYIRSCCTHRAKREFAGDRDVTFRFAEQWDGMSRAERLKDVGAG